MTTLLARLDDAVNPVVVKEVRQAVQSRFVVSVIGLFLLASLGAVCVLLLGDDGTGANFTAGRGLFMTLQGIAAVTCIVFVPMYAAVRMSAERGGEQPDLLYVSTLRPTRIIFGKLWSSLLLVLLIYSCVLPFMTLTYLLRGVDLPSMFVTVGVHLLIVTGALAAAIFLAALPVTPLLKAIIGLIFLGLLGYAAGLGVAAGVGLSFMGVGSMLSNSDFWLIALLLVIGAGGGAGLLLLLAVSVIAPASANRALPVRLYLTAWWAFVPALLLVVNALSTSFDLDDALAFAWLMPSVVLLCGALLIATAEREAWTPRVLRRVPHNPAWRAIFWLLSSGSAGGIAWAVVMTLLTFGVLLLLHGLGVLPALRGDAREGMQAMAIFAAYSYCYALTGVALRWPMRHALLPRVATIFALGLLVVGCILPLILAFFVNPRHWDRNEILLFLFNPFGAAAMWADHEPQFQSVSLIVLITWAALVTLACLPWLAHQLRGFRPLAATAPSARVATPEEPLSPRERVPASSPAGEGE